MLPYNKEAKRGRQFGDGMTWYPNLISAIIDRELNRHRKQLRTGFETLEYAYRVKARYERRFKYTEYHM
jgi:hypothetical protein